MSHYVFKRKSGPLPTPPRVKAEFQKWFESNDIDAAIGHMRFDIGTEDLHFFMSDDDAALFALAFDGELTKIA